MVAAIIPARGGSKRLPRKNVKEFCNLPLIAWSIIQAKSSFLVNEVFVTTDDDEIAEISEKYGAKVIRRPEWPDADSCSAVRPLLHACDYIKNNYEGIDVCVFMLPTAPINKLGDIDSGLWMYYKLGIDIIRPLYRKREVLLFEQTGHFTARAFINNKTGNILDQGPGWTICSLDYYLHYYSFLNDDSDKALDNIENWPKKEIYFYPVESWQYSDLDTEDEFRIGELIFNEFILKGKGSDIYFQYRSNEDNYKKIINSLEKEFTYKDTFSQSYFNYLSSLSPKKNIDISELFGNRNQQ